MPYNADGSKIRRTFTAETGGAAKVTTYINEYVYEETNTTPIAAQFISFEEGRIVPVTRRNEDNGFDAIFLAGNITLPSGKQGGIDSPGNGHKNFRQALWYSVSTNICLRFILP